MINAMKFIKQSILYVITSLFLVISTASHAVLVDLSGISVDGAAPTVIIVAEDETLDAAFDIFYDFSIEAFPSSWGSEMSITLEQEYLYDPLSPLVIDGIIDCEFGNTSGIFSCSSVISVLDSEIDVGFGDLWTISFFDSFNDAVDPDYEFLAGSFIAWGDDAPTSVPAPGILSLLGLGLVALGFSRRKKA